MFELEKNDNGNNKIVYDVNTSWYDIKLQILWSSKNQYEHS